MGVFMGYETPEMAPIPTPRPGGLGSLGGVPQQQGGGFRGFLQRPVVNDTLNAVFDSMISSPRNNVLQNFGPAYSNAQQMRAYGDKQKQEQAALSSTKKWLIDQGIPEAEAEAAIANPPVLNAIIKRIKGGDDAQYGLNPIWGTDENGSPALGVLGDDGTFKTIDTGGFQLSTGTEQIDLGDRYAIKDKRSGQIVGYIPKENFKEAYDTASGTASGKTQAEAAGALPGVSSIAALVDSQVQDLKNDPYLPSMLGPVNSRLPNMTADAARVQARIDQIQGGAFLQARQMLKGGGAITDYEGQKAEAAFVRMNAAQNEKDFKDALDEFNRAVQDGVRKLEAQAAGSNGTATAVPSAQTPAQRLRFNPATGDFE